MNFTRKVSLVPFALMLVMILGAGGFFSQKSSAFAWDISASCADQTHVNGTLFVPSNASGTPYTVFVEYRTGPWNWQWVPEAGQILSGTGAKAFNMDVSRTPSDAVALRVLYKDVNGVYGGDMSSEFAPCRPAPPAAPPHLEVYDLQAECTNVARNIIGGMIGVPAGAEGLPYVVFMEYHDPGGSEENWHWVSGSGSQITQVGFWNFEFDASPTPAGVTELRVRYKSIATDPWLYGPEISAVFSPCTSPTPAPTSPPVPGPQPSAPQPPTTTNQSQNVTIHNSSGSGSSATSGSTSSGGGSSSSGTTVKTAQACCSHGCCPDGNTQTQSQTQTQTAGDVNVTVGGSGGDNGTTGGNGGVSDFWDWWWLIPIALGVLAIAAVVGLFVRGRGDRMQTERTTRVETDNRPKDPPTS